MGKFRSCIVVFVAIATAGFLGNLCLQGDRQPRVVSDGWWGRGKREPDSDQSLRKFAIDVSNGTLTDLKIRLDNARLGEDLLNNDNFHYGFQVNYMKEVLHYWKTKYNWREQEKILNQFDHYRTKIEGIDVHFIHAKPKNAKAAKPILVVHGWPGSVWEFHKIIPMLTDPTQYGGSESDTFEVICPSIPGYGFSEAPHRQGFTAADTARLFLKLMKRLGFNKFYYQGGDWGSFIGQIMTQAYPEHVKGIHLNMFQPNSQSLAYNMKLLIGAFFPKIVGITEQEASRVYPLSRLMSRMLTETGYLHIQATRPDTIAFGLNDSPVGLAAYILEKFSCCTNEAYLDLPDGGLTRKYSMDELLTNVMIYWVTGSIGPSVRFYKENIGEILRWDSFPVNVPTGLAWYEHEPLPIPRAFAETKFKNIVQFSYMNDGGHFAALEGPERLAQDVRSFVRLVEGLH